MPIKLFPLPHDIWITYQIFQETVIERATVLEATYDNLGYKSLYYKTKNGSHVWDRRFREVDWFETKQQAIDSVADGNYYVQT